MSPTRQTIRAITTWKSAPLFFSLLLLFCLAACGRTVGTRVENPFSNGPFSNIPVGTGNSPEPGTNGHPEVSPTGHSDSILAGNGAAYVGSDNGRLYALSAGTGKAKWQQRLGGQVIVFAVTGGVVYASNAASGSGQSPASSAGVYAVSAASGQVLWQFHQAGADEFFVDVDGGMVFASTSASGNHFTVYGLQAATGHLVWQHATASYFPGLLGAVNGVVYTAEATNPDPSAGNSTLSALNAANGRALWQLAIAPADGIVSGPPIESNGIIYVDTSIGAVYALHPANGTILWHVSGSRIGGGPPGPPSPTPYSPIVANGMVYSGNQSGVSAYRASDGSQVWHYQQLGIGPFVPQPVLVSGVLYASIDSTALALNANTGTALWQDPGAAAPVGPMFVANGVVITDTSTLNGLKASDGSQLWKVALPQEGGRMGGGAAGPDALGGGPPGGAIFYVGADSGMVAALNAATGKQLWQFAIPELPVPTSPAFNAAITFKPGTSFTQALLAVTNLGLKTDVLCSFSWTNLDSLQASFPSSQYLLVDATVASAPQWYDRLRALPEVASLQANVFASCPMEPVNPPGPKFLGQQQAGTYLRATFSTATSYASALEGIDGLGFRLATPCYEQARARGDKPTWQSMSQAGAFAQSHTLILATTQENATIWLQQLHALLGVQAVNASYTASC